MEQKDTVAGLSVFPSPKGCRPVVNGSWVPDSGCVWVAGQHVATWQACQALCEKNHARPAVFPRLGLC